MITLLTGFPDNVLAVACEGRVTRSDYRDVLIPAAEAALRRHDRVRLYYELTSQFVAFDAAAAWEDFRIGVAHWSRWERVAVASDIEWVRLAVRAFGFLMPGEARVFPVSDATEARRWIAADIR